MDIVWQKCVSSPVCGRNLHDWVSFKKSFFFKVSLQWRHNEHDGVSNHHPHDCLLIRLFRHQCSASLAFVLGIHWWSVNSPQRASKAENDVIMWKIYVSSMSDRNLWDCPQCVTEICEMVSVKHTVRTDISMKYEGFVDLWCAELKRLLLQECLLEYKRLDFNIFFSVLHNPLGQTADRFSMDLEWGFKYAFDDSIQICTPAFLIQGGLKGQSFWYNEHLSSISYNEDCIDRLVQERRNSIANTLKLCLSCTNPSIWSWECYMLWYNKNFNTGKITPLYSCHHVPESTRSCQGPISI